MPNDTDDYDESNTTAEEFDAMWESATPVEIRLDDVAVNAPGLSFWLNAPTGVTIYRTTHTNEMDEHVHAPTIVPDTTAPAAAPVRGSNVPLPA